MLLNTNQALDYYQVSRPTLRRMREQGKIKYVKFSERIIRYPVKEKGEKK